MNDYKQLLPPPAQTVYSFCVHGISLKIRCMKCHYQVGKRRRLLHIPFTSTTDSMIAVRKVEKDEEASN